MKLEGVSVIISVTKQALLKSIMQKKERFDEAVSIALDLHSMVHLDSMKIKERHI